MVCCSSGWSQTRSARPCGRCGLRRGIARPSRRDRGGSRAHVSWPSSAPASESSVSERVSTSRFVSRRSTRVLRVGSDAAISDLPRASGHSELRIGDRITAVLAWCRRHVKDAAFGLLPAVAALVAAGAVLELWHSSLRIQYAYSSDALFVEAVTKNLAHGWSYTNAQLAAPFVQQLFD